MTVTEKADKYFSAGLKCYLDKDYEGAINYCTKAIELGKDDVNVYFIRALTYMYIGNYLKVVEDLTKITELDGNDEFTCCNRGFAYMCIGEYAKAIDDYTKGIELGTNDKNIYIGRGIAYRCLGDYIKAVEDFTKAIELDKNNQFAYRERGFAYIRVGGYTKAIGDFTTAIELGANNKDIYIIRGIAYIGAKEYSKAIYDFKEVIKLNKNDDEKNNTTSDSVYIPNKIELTDNIFDLIPDILQNNKSKILLDDETLNLIEIVCSCYDLMDEIKIKPSEMSANKFVHYTKASTLQFLLQKDHTAKLRLNNAVYMNDPEEGQILKKVLCQLDENKELENLLKDEDVKNYTYLTCFSPYDKRDELPMWVHYGDGGKGVGLVFNKSFFDEADLYKVQYIDVKNFDINKLDQNVQDKITAIFDFLKRDEIKNNTRTEFKIYVNIILNYVSYLFKDKAYEYENEVRILNYRDYASKNIKTAVYESGIPRLYIDYKQCITDKNCEEVIAGPKANYTEIAAYAKFVGISTVSKSEIKYR